MANSPSAGSPSAAGLDKRESGFQRSGEPESSAHALIQAHNRELLERTGDLMELSISVLSEQRDKALKLLATANEGFEEERAQLASEQDKFITFLMSDHEQKFAEVQRALEVAQQELTRQRALTPPEPVLHGTDPHHASGALVDQVNALKQALESASAEVEETRQDATRLQEERDEAIRAIDDARVELMTEVEAARDECFQMETRLDDANRLLEDARDQVRDEAYRFNEELSELRREMDEKNEEIRRLRARLVSHVAETKASLPPPPPAGQELERARREAQSLRQQVIETKRELARVTRELDLKKTTRETPARTAGTLERRPAAVPRPAAPVPETRRFDAKTPGRRVTPLGFFNPTTKRD